MRSIMAALLLIAGGSCAAPAADIREVAPISVGDEEMQKITVSGSIEPGDAATLESLFSDEMRTVVSLSGAGGDYAEALTLADMINDEPAMTIVEAGASCFDACAIAFLGGSEDTDDSGDYAAARSLAPTAKLGFRAPALALPAALDKAAVENAYALALKFIADFVRASDDLFVEPAALAELLLPRNGEPYVVTDAYRLAHVGVEVQGIAPPAALTLSMARNLCQLGWKPTEGEPDARTGDAMAKSGWTAAAASFAAESGHFGDGVPVRRTLIPFEFMSEDPADGFVFCIVDQAKDAGALQVACRGFIYGGSLAEGMERARAFDRPVEQGGASEADIGCDIPSLIEPLTPLGTSAVENRWALVPGGTPLGRIAETLAGYAAKEPPL